MSARPPETAAAAAAVDEAVALQAAEWFFLLHAGDASAVDHRRWALWHAAHPSHALAWERAQRVGQTFAQLPPALALPVLDRPPRLRRRAAVQALAVLLTAAPAGWLTWRHSPARDWLADHRTATGEGRVLALADGSRLQLDTGTAVDIEFDSAQRLIHLHSGAIYIETAPDPQRPARPLRVATAQGRMQALGTRFTVRQDADSTRVAVFDGAVRLQPAAAPEPGLVLQAGQQALMSATAVAPAQPVAPEAGSWTRGVLHVRDMRLQDFAAELARYRPGVLRCDPAVGDLRVSGLFQLADTTPVLDSLPQILPVQVVYRTRYWVVLTQP